MATFEERVCSLVTEFEGFTREQQNEVLKRLLLKCQPLQLRLLYSELQPLLAVDFVSSLPKEITERIFSYLSAQTLCYVARCNMLWRERANHNPTWHQLCVQKGWDKFGQDLDLSLDTPTINVRPTSPSKTPPPAFFDLGVNATNLLQSSMCRWKSIYVHAFYLQENWTCGRYIVAPILRGHKEPINSIACNGKVLVSGASDNTVRVWDVKERKCTHVLDAPHTDSIRCVQLKAPICVTGCADSIIRVFDINTGQCLRSLQGHSGGIEHICFDGRIIVSASTDRTLRVWNAKTGKLLHTLSGHTDEIVFVKMRAGHVVSTSWDETIRVWNVSTGVCHLTLRGHSEVVYCCQFDEKRIVSGGGDNTVIIWNARTGDSVCTLTGHAGEVYCLAYNEDIIASGSADSTVRLWSHEGVSLHTLQEHIGVVRCLHLSGDRLISGGDRKKIALWNVKSGKLLNVVHRNPTLLHLMWADETKLITASPEKPGTITIINYW